MLHRSTITVLSILTLSFLALSCQNNSSSSSKKQQQSKTKTDKPDKKGGLAHVEGSGENKTILAVAQASKSHNTLAKAIKAAGLANTLANPGPFTAFAPTDKAFDKLPDGTLKSLMKEKNKKKLSDILQRHVSPVPYSKEKLKKMAEKNSQLFMANGDYITPKIKDGKITIGGAQIIQSIDASNGKIHVVDKVILPEK